MAAPDGWVDYRQAYELGRSLGESVLREQGVLVNAESVLDLIQLQNLGSQAVEEGLLHAVREARRFGRSWTEIGLRVGLTKQGAQQRFGPKLGDGLGEGDQEEPS